MMSMPTAVSTHIYASELGGNEEFVSVEGFVTTVVSLVLVFASSPVLH